MRVKKHITALFPSESFTAVYRQQLNANLSMSMDGDVFKPHLLHRRHNRTFGALLPAHGLNYLSVCLWLPRRAVVSVSRTLVLCGPEVCADTPQHHLHHLHPLSASSQPAAVTLRPGSCLSSRIDANFCCFSLVLTPLHYLTLDRLGASVAPFSFLSTQSRQISNIYLDRLSKGMQHRNTIAAVPFGSDAATVFLLERKDGNSLTCGGKERQREGRVL